MRLLATVCLAVLSLPFARAEAIIINEDRLFPRAAFVQRPDAPGPSKLRYLTIDAKFQGDTELGTLAINRWNVLDGGGNVIFSLTPRTFTFTAGNAATGWQTHTPMPFYIGRVRMREWSPVNSWGEWWVNMIPPAHSWLTLSDPLVPSSPPQNWRFMAMVTSPIGLSIPEPTSISLAGACLAAAVVIRRRGVGTVC